MSRNYRDLSPAAHLPHPDRHLQPQQAGDPGQCPHHRPAYQDGGDHGPEFDPAKYLFGANNSFGRVSINRGYLMRDSQARPGGHLVNLTP